MVKLGDRRTVHPATLDGYEKGKPRPLTGTVVYIHPAGRFCRPPPGLPEKYPPFVTAPQPCLEPPRSRT